MKYGFKVYQMQVEEHIFWVAESNALKGCVGQGDTIEEAIRELGYNEKEWLVMAKEEQFSIPTEQPLTPAKYSGKLSLRMSPKMHEVAKSNADAQGVSLNQYINDAISFYNGIVSQQQYGFIFNISKNADDLPVTYDFSQKKQRSNSYYRANRNRNTYNELNITDIAEFKERKRG